MNEKTGQPSSGGDAAGRFFPSFLIKMHETRGNFMQFRLKIAEKEGKNRPGVQTAAGGGVRKSRRERAVRATLFFCGTLVLSQIR
jgi:hypothetical protein